MLGETLRGLEGSRWRVAPAKADVTGAEMGAKV